MQKYIVLKWHSVFMSPPPHSPKVTSVISFMYVYQVLFWSFISAYLHIEIDFVIMCKVGFLAGSFVAVLLKISDIQMHTFKSYNLINFNICIQSWNHHHNQDCEFICHPQSFLTPLGNPFLPPPSRPSLTCFL